MSEVTQYTIKYRPHVWDEVAGQKIKIKELRKRALEKDYSNVTYFTGLSGTGKDTMKLIYLKTMFCKDVDETGNPCNACKTCQSIDNYDFEGIYGLEVYDSSNVNIEKARSISDSAKTVLFGDTTKRVYIFNELQEFKKNKAALKNLLTTFERPIKDVHFIFDSMELVQFEDKNSKTSISDRAQVYKTESVDVFEIVERLEYICKKEKVEIDTEEKANVLLILAEKANGSVRNAVHNLERVVKSELWTEDLLYKELDLHSNSFISDIVNGLCLGNFSNLDISVTEDLVNDIKYILSVFMKHLTGVHLNTFEQSKIEKLKNTINIANIKNVMDAIFVISQLPYFDKSIAYYKLLESAYDNKPKLRRRAT